MKNIDLYGSNGNVRKKPDGSGALILVGFSRVKGTKGNLFTFRTIGMGGGHTRPFGQKRFRIHPFAGSRFLAGIIPDFFAYRTDRQNIFI